LFCIENPKQKWTAQYNTWLLIQLTPKGVVFSFLSNTKRNDWGFVGLSCSLFAQRTLRDGSPEGLRQLATFDITAAINAGSPFFHLRR